jgi:chromosome segregation ATPase
MSPMTEGTNLGMIAEHIEVALRSLAPTETAFAQERLRRQEAKLAAYLEQYRLAEESIAAFDPEIAAAQAEVDRTTQLAKDAEAQSAKSKKPSPAWDAVIAAWQTSSDAAEPLESLKQRKLATQSEFDRLSAQRSSIDAALVALRAELARVTEFYSITERKHNDR